MNDAIVVLFLLAFSSAIEAKKSQAFLWCPHNKCACLVTCYLCSNERLEGHATDSFLVKHNVLPTVRHRFGPVLVFFWNIWLCRRIILGGWGFPMNEMMIGVVGHQRWTTRYFSSWPLSSDNVVPVLRDLGYYLLMISWGKFMASFVCDVISIFFFLWTTNLVYLETKQQNHVSELIHNKSLGMPIQVCLPNIVYPVRQLEVYMYDLK